MHKRYIYIFLLLMVFSLNGCFKDDLSFCPIKLQVYFESVMTKYEYENITDRLDLYVYKDQVLMEKFTYSKEELKQINYSPIIPVTYCDSYTLLALTNLSDCYSVSGTDKLSTFHVALNTAIADTVKEKQTDLHYAKKVLPIFEANEANQIIQETLHLYKNTNHIYLNVSFNGEYNFRATDLQARLQGNNGTFNHQNKCHAASNRVYHPHVVDTDVADADIQFWFTTMQLWTGNDLELYLEESAGGKKVEKARLRIMDEISKVYDTDAKLDQEDIFIIELVLENDFTIFELKINDWYIIKSGIEV